MEQKILKRSKWKIPMVEELLYQFHFLNQFSQNNPEFLQEMKNILLPLYLDIFGKHEETTPTLSEYNWTLVPQIVEKDYSWFFISVNRKLKVFNYPVINNENFSEKELKAKTDALLDGMISIIERFNLVFDNNDATPRPWMINSRFGSNQLYFPIKGSMKPWVAHALLCQLEAGIPYLILPMTQVVHELPFEMLEELWRELPEVQQVLIMRAQEIYYRELKIFDEHKHEFESLDTFMKTQLFKTLPEPSLFGYRPYNIYEDMDNYEKNAVKAYKQHIKNYTRRMSEALKKNGFKRNNVEDYDQTEWLVIWNKHKVNFLWEIIQYIPQFEEIDVTNKVETKRAEDTLRKAFNKFEKFDLPMRPFGQKRKNSESKTDSSFSTKKK